MNARDTEEVGPCMGGCIPTLVVVIVLLGTGVITQCADIADPAEGAANDPPESIIVLRPSNHTTVLEGSQVSFAVEVYDPDMVNGQVLQVVWSSNVSGELMTLFTVNRLSFSTTELPVGDHNITVTASDGNASISTWFEVTVLEYLEPSIRTYPLGPKVGTGYAATTIALLALITSLAYMVIRRRPRRRDRSRSEPRTTPPPSTTGLAGAAVPAGPREGVEGEGSDFASLSRKLGEMISILERQRELDRAAAPAAGGQEPPWAPEGPVESLQVIDTVEDRERTMEIRETMKALTQLPGGLPLSLSGWEFSELSRAIVDGERRIGPDGYPYVRLGNNWYNANTSNLGRFLRPLEGSFPSAPTPEEGARTVELIRMLEERRREGRLSEETYWRLRRKYESELRHS